MRERCNNPNHPEFKNYGGRGIKVCKRWNDFTNFLADVGPPNTVFDRYPDNDGNYEPGNVRWATWKESNKNRRPSKVRSDSLSGIKGVHQRGRRWWASIRNNGNRTYLGMFDSAKAAHHAYLAAARKLNFFDRKDLA